MTSTEAAQREAMARETQGPHGQFLDQRHPSPGPASIDNPDGG
jgi:hypothetical protein